MVSSRLVCWFLTIGYLFFTKVLEEELSIIEIYTGVCIDTACTLGMCAERNAIANMITNGEGKIVKLGLLLVTPVS